MITKISPLLFAIRNILKAAVLLFIPAILAGWSVEYLSHRFTESQVSATQVKGLISTKIPGIFINESLIDLGLVSPESTPHATFTLYNKNKKVASVEKVETSCGCTKADVKTPVVQPNSSVPIEVTLDPSRLGNSSFTKSIVVHIADQPGAIVLSVIGTIDPKDTLSVYPTVIDGKPLLAGGSTSESIFVRGSAKILKDLPDAIQVVLDGAPVEITTVFDATDKIISDREIPITVKAPLNLQPGSHRGVIRLCEAGVNSKETVIYIQSLVSSPVICTPRSLILSGSDRQGSIRLQLLDSSTIQNPVITSNFPIEISTVSEKPSVMRVDVKATDGVAQDGEIQIKIPSNQINVSIPYVILR